MRFASTFLTVLSLLVPALAAPSSGVPVDALNTGKYIVTLKSSVSVPSFLSSSKIVATHSHWGILNAFAAVLDPITLSLLNASPDVESVVEDGTMRTSGFVSQTDAPWGISRIDHRASLAGQDATTLDFKFNYESAAGRGVDVYIIDTGINTEHVQFGGRARWGATFGGYPDVDDNGHGTHCAGTAASAQFGVAKKANLIAVKVLSATGAGYISDIISGMDWVLAQVSQSGRPSVASMSLGGDPSQPVDDAVAALTNAGVHVVVAAGNSNEDADNYSPARAPSAITVGASTIEDARAFFSDYGSVVDIFAPGQNITSTWIGSNTATQMLQGTSMAAPHISGLVAYTISLFGNSPPEIMSKIIQDLGIDGVLSDIPDGTANILAQMPLAF